MSPNQLTVRSAEKGLDLLSYLSRHLKLSRKKSKELLDHKLVFVNQRRVWMAKHTLFPGDEIEVQQAESNQAPQPTTVLFEDDYLLVANKNSGTLSNSSDESFEEALRVSTRNRQLEAVHRLDRDTSGCLIFAKNHETMEKMKQIFSEQQVSKVYFAIVQGCPAQQQMEIRTPIDNLPAFTRFEVLSKGPHASHLKVSILTGRTHQIRKHLASIRHPVIGDKVYSTAPLPSALLRQVPRQMLHASILSFKHPVTGKNVRVTAPLPSDYRTCLKAFHLR